MWHGRLRLYVGQLRPQGAEGDHGPSWGAIATAGTHGAARHGRVATVSYPRSYYDGRREGDMVPQWAGASRSGPAEAPGSRGRPWAIMQSNGNRGQAQGRTGPHAAQPCAHRTLGPNGAAGLLTPSHCRHEEQPAGRWHGHSQSVMRPRSDVDLREHPIDRSVSRSTCTGTWSGRARGINKYIMLVNTS